MQEFVDELRAGALDTGQVNLRLANFARRRAIARLLDKLRSQEATIDTKAARNIALGLAPHGSLLPREEGSLSFNTTFMQGAILIRQLVKRVAENEREALALVLIKRAVPLQFASECQRWIRVPKGEGEDDRILTLSQRRHWGRRWPLESAKPR